MCIRDRNIIDPTQFQKESRYYDPKSSPEKPRWDCVKVKYLFKAEKFLCLPKLKTLFNEQELLLVRKGNRLSIFPIKIEIAKLILEKIK